MEDKNSKLVKVLKLILWSILMMVVGGILLFVANFPVNQDNQEPAVVDIVEEVTSPQDENLIAARQAAYDCLSKFYSEAIQEEYDSFKAQKYTRLKDLIDALLEKSLTSDDSNEIYDLINLIYGEVEKLEIQF